MRVANPNYARQPLRLPAREGFPGFSGEGDARGAFDVPDAWGKWLCSTPGWKAEVAVPVAVAPAALPEPEPETEEPEPKPEEPDPDADELFDSLGKNDLFALADKNGIELTGEQKKLRVSELREVIRAALTGAPP